MDDEPARRPTLARLTAAALAEYLPAAPVGEAMPTDPYPDFCSCLERLIPAVLLMGGHDEWRSESLDGIVAIRIVRTGGRSVELLGTAILMSDQAVTPVSVTAALTEPDAVGELAEFHVRLGEPGSGQLGISGPGCATSESQKLRFGLVDREHEIDWVYEGYLGRVVDGDAGSCR